MSAGVLACRWRATDRADSPWKLYAESLSGAPEGRGPYEVTFKGARRGSERSSASVCFENRCSDSEKVMFVWRVRDNAMEDGV